MRDERAFWIGGFVAGFLVGLALSLTYTWLINPPPFSDTTPAALNPHDKEIYTVLIAAAYGAHGDLDRTRERLTKLEDPDIKNTIVALAERYINEGRDARDVRALARLADALGGTSAAMRPFIATPTSTPTPVPTPTPQPPSPTPTRVVRATPSAAEGPGGTPTVSAPEGPGGTPTPSPTLTGEAPETFEIVQSTALCDPASDGLLRVYVRDQAGQGIPGIQILVDWPGGEDRFFTGFRPEADLGYADFEMEPGEIYQVELADRQSEAAQEVGADLADRCPGLPPDVQPSWQIVFQIGNR